MQPQELATGRKRDGVAIVRQRNAERQVVIESVNEVLLEMLSYAQNTLVQKPLAALIGNALNDIVQEELEYHDDAPDIGDIIGRQRQVRIKDQQGKELVVSCTVLRLVPEDQALRFQLIIPDETEQRARSKLKEFLKSNLESRLEIDASTHLPNRATTEHYLTLLRSYITNQPASIAFACARLDRFESNRAHYGPEQLAILQRHVASFCQATFRSEDVVTTLNPATLGIILFDISRESARMVLNRLRGQIRSHRIEFGGKSDFSVTVSLAFDMLDVERGETLLHRCEHAISTVETDARNSLIELTSE